MTACAALCASALSGCTQTTPAASVPGSVSRSPTPASASVSTVTSTKAVIPTATTAPSSAPHSSQSGPVGIEVTVPSHAQQTQTPVAVGSDARFGTGVSVAVTALSRFTATAHGIGQIGGPAVEADVALTNGTTHSISLDSVTVTAQDASGTPLLPLQVARLTPLGGTLAAGKIAHGAYAFTLPSTAHQPLTLGISYTADAPVVLIEGHVA